MSKRKKKTFWFDVETTGLSAQSNDIVQIAALVDIDGEVVDRLYENIAPFDGENISPQALIVNGLTKEQVLSFTNPAKFFQKKLIPFLEKYVDKYNKEDKFVLAGYNVDFDKKFLSEFFRKNKHKYFGSYFEHRTIDPMHLCSILTYLNLMHTENLKLKTLCAYFKIEINAHDALSDIEATRKLMHCLFDTYIRKEPLDGLIV